jgi:hypothetical protein
MGESDYPYDNLALNAEAFLKRKEKFYFFFLSF